MNTLFSKGDRVRTIDGDFATVNRIEAPPRRMTEGRYTLLTDNGRKLEWYSGSRMKVAEPKIMMNRE